MNPLVPTTYDAIMSLTAIAALILAVWAIILIARSDTSPATKIMAGLGVIIFPIIGPVTYLLYRYTSANGR